MSQRSVQGRQAERFFVELALTENRAPSLMQLLKFERCYLSGLFMQHKQLNYIFFFCMTVTRLRDLHIRPALLPHVMLDAEDGALFGRLAFEGSAQHPLRGAGPGNAHRNRGVFERHVIESMHEQNS